MANTQKKAERCEDSRRETRTWLMHTAVETSRVADNNIVVNIMSHLKTKNIARCLPAHWFLLHRRFWSRFKAFCKMSNQLVFLFGSLSSHGLFLSSFPSVSKNEMIKMNIFLISFRYGGNAGESSMNWRLWREGWGLANDLVGNSWINLALKFPRFEMVELWSFLCSEQ